MTKPDSVLFMGATAEELESLARHAGSARGVGWLRRATDEKLMTDLMTDLRTYEAAGSTLDNLGQQRLAYDYAHALRNEISRRKLWSKLPPSRHIPRCEVCQHGTEKLFRAHKSTHDIVNNEGEEIFPALCVRCWSELHVDAEAE
jgi:hypothetical protein